MFLAKEKGVKYYYCMRKKDLINALNGLEIDTSYYNCEHNILKRYCKECEGSQVCKHKKQRTRCKECGGGSLCENNRRHYECKFCKGENL